jgi:hypothetical protein
MRLAFASLLLRAAKECWTGKSLYSLRKSVDVIAFIAPGGLNLETADGLVGDKVEAHLRALRASGLNCLICLYPGSATDLRLVSPPAFGLEAFVLRAALVSRAAEWRSRVRRRPLRNGAADSPRLAASRSSRFWSMVLEATRPRLIMGIGLPSDLCAEADRREIPSVEVQHGYLHPDAFAFWWPRASANSTCSNLRPKLFAISVGYPRIDETLVGPKLDMSVGRGFGDVSTRDREPREPVVVHVSLQYKAADSPDPGNMISGELYIALQELENSSTVYSYRFRIHPAVEDWPEARATTRWIRSRFPTATVTRPRQSYLLNDISDADFLLTHNSSAAYEAALVGVRSVLVGNEPRSAFPPELFDLGFVFRVSPKEVDQCLTELRSKLVAPHSPSVSGSLLEAFTSLTGSPFENGADHES